jgi:hypothetical protein
MTKRGFLGRRNSESNIKKNINPLKRTAETLVNVSSCATPFNTKRKLQFVQVVYSRVSSDLHQALLADFLHFDTQQRCHVLLEPFSSYRSMRTLKVLSRLLLTTLCSQ